MVQITLGQNLSLVLYTDESNNIKYRIQPTNWFSEENMPTLPVKNAADLAEALVYAWDKLAIHDPERTPL